MIKLKDNISILLITINIIFLLYFASQLLIFTNEFALNNIGFFNHAVAGLCEIIGIIFLSLSVGLFLSIINGCKNYEPLFITILFMQILISFNFWRYVFTNSPGESNLQTIQFNAIFFSLISLIMLLLIFRLRVIQKLGVKK